MDGRRSQQCLFSAVSGNQSTILQMPSGMHYESTTADESCHAVVSSIVFGNMLLLSD